MILEFLTSARHRASSCRSPADRLLPSSVTCASSLNFSYRAFTSSGASAGAMSPDFRRARWRSASDIEDVGSRFWS